VFDEALVVPDPGRSIEEGAIDAWRRGPRRLIVYHKQILRALAKHAGVDPAAPWRDLPEAFRRRVLDGSGAEEVEYGYWRGGAYRRVRKPFEGVLPNLRRRLAETESDYMRQKLRQYMTRQPCTACGGEGVVLCSSCNGDGKKR